MTVRFLKNQYKISTYILSFRYLNFWPPWTRIMFIKYYTIKKRIFFAIFYKQKVNEFTKWGPYKREETNERDMNTLTRWPVTFAQIS